MKRLKEKVCKRKTQAGTWINLSNIEQKNLTKLVSSIFHLSNSRVESNHQNILFVFCVTVITTILCFIDMRAWGSCSVCDDGVRKEGSIQYKIYTSRLSAHFYFWVVCVYNVQYYYHSLSNGYFLYENEWKLDRKPKWRKEKVA